MGTDQEAHKNISADLEAIRAKLDFFDKKWDDTQERLHTRINALFVAIAAARQAIRGEAEDEVPEEVESGEVG